MSLDSGTSYLFVESWLRNRTGNTAGPAVGERGTLPKARKKCDALYTSCIVLDIQL